MWIDHWGFTRDPFAELDSTYVSLPGHDEAAARLVYAIETHARRIVFNAPAGMGKSAVMRKVLTETRNPLRKFATIACPPDGTLFLTVVAEGLGNRLGRNPDRLTAWRSLDQSIRAAALEGMHVVIVIDHCQQLADSSRRDLELLIHLGSHSDAGVSVVQISRPDADRRSEFDDSGILSIELLPLTRSQVDGYVRSKMSAMGCDEPIFTPRAITRLQALSRGVPRRVQQLATLSLMAAAVRRLEIVPPDVVDGVATEIEL
jgi:type II secretory pathway predicted ATPase ExeA